MSYENIKLWFAKDKNENIVTIDEINDENKNSTYLCPVCGSNLKPKAVKSKQVTSHFAHIDASKCNSESQIHFWFKHKFIEKGDKFTVASDKNQEYICKEILVEQSYETSYCTYRPDVTVLTECGNTIFFEMAFTNKKKVKDYLDSWLDLKNIVVEVDIKDLITKNDIYVFKALFYEGKCFNTKKNDTYYNTIGKYKEKMLNDNVNNEIKERIRKLDWFWEDVFKYKKGEVDIEHMAVLIDSMKGKEKEIVWTILKKQTCNQLLLEYQKFKENLIKKSQIEIFNNNKPLIENELNIINDRIKKEYGFNFFINHEFQNSNRDIDIVIKISIEDINHTRYFRKSMTQSVEYIIKDILKFTEQSVEVLIEEQKMKQIENSDILLNAISMLNEKYSKIDQNYEIEFNYPHFILNYNRNKCIKNNLIKQIEKSKDSQKLFNIFDKVISDYRKKLIIIRNRNKISEFLNYVSSDFEVLKDKMHSNKSYWFTKLQHEFKSESHLIVSIKNDGNWDWETISIKNGVMTTNSYYGIKNKVNKVNCDVLDTENLIEILKEKIKKLTDNFSVKCKRCKEYALIDVSNEELINYLKENNDITNETLSEVFQHKCNECKIREKNVNFAINFKNEVINYFSSDEIQNFTITINEDWGENDNSVAVHIDDDFTFHSFIVKEDQVIFNSESDEYRTFNLDESDVIRNFIKNKIPDIIMKNKHTKEFAKSIQYLTDVNIKLIDNSYIIPNDIKFKYYKNIDHLDFHFISSQMIKDIKRFKSNKELVFMLDKKINIPYEIDRLNSYGFKKVSKLENCVQKTGGVK